MATKTVNQKPSTAKPENKPAAARKNVATFQSRQLTPRELFEIPVPVFSPAEYMRLTTFHEELNAVKVLLNALWPPAEAQGRVVIERVLAAILGDFALLLKGLEERIDAAQRKLKEGGAQ